MKDNWQNMSIEELIQVFGTESGKDREEARDRLVSKGNVAVSSLVDLLDHPQYIYRWEAMMTLKNIKEESLIPVFIKRLTDREQDIRWIAAKGLIHQGKATIKPLLDLLIDNSESVFAIEGAHHIFNGLHKNKQLPDSFPFDTIMPLLENTRHTEHLKVVAFNVLHAMGGV